MTKEKAQKMKLLSFGRSGEIRTRGLLNPIQARYQTALHPELTGNARQAKSIIPQRRGLSSIFLQKGRRAIDRRHS